MSQFKYMMDLSLSMSKAVQVCKLVLKGWCPQDSIKNCEFWSFQLMSGSPSLPCCKLWPALGGTAIEMQGERHRCYWVSPKTLAQTCSAHLRHLLPAHWPKIVVFSANQHWSPLNSWEILGAANGQPVDSHTSHCSARLQLLLPHFRSCLVSVGTWGSF